MELGGRRLSITKWAKKTEKERKREREREKKWREMRAGKRWISGASRSKPDLIILAERKRERERERKKSRSALSLLTMQSLSASHRLSRDKKDPTSLRSVFCFLFFLFCFSQTAHSLIMTQPNARFLVEY